MSAQMPLFPNILANHETCKKFCGLYEECLDALHDSFPDYTPVSTALEQYRTTVKSNENAEINLIKSWHHDMIPLYTRSDAHDNTLWESMPLFRDLNVLALLRPDGVIDETLILWEYVDSMARYARIYNVIPDAMMDTIQKSAMNILGRVQRNEIKMDVNNLDWDEMKNIGQSIISELDQNDVQNFTNNITGLAKNLNINNLQDVFKVVGDLPGIGDVLGNENVMQTISNVMEQDSTQELMKNIDKMMNGGNLEKKE